MGLGGTILLSVDGDELMVERSDRRELDGGEIGSTQARGCCLLSMKQNKGFPAGMWRFKRLLVKG